MSKCIKRNSVSLTLRKTVITGLCLVALIAVFDYAPISYLANNAHAETGIGKDIFKVVVSVFGANKEIGDILALVTVNDNSKAKLFDLHSTSPGGTNVTSTQNDSIIEFVALFEKSMLIRAITTGHVLLHPILCINIVKKEVIPR